MWDKNISLDVPNFIVKLTHLHHQAGVEGELSHSVDGKSEAVCPSSVETIFFELEFIPKEIRNNCLNIFSIIS